MRGDSETGSPASRSWEMKKEVFLSMKTTEEKIEEVKRKLKALETKRRIDSRKERNAMKKKRVSLLISISAYICQGADIENLGKINEGLKSGRYEKLVNYCRQYFNLPALEKEKTEKAVL
jgi:uncharacterized protein YeeX (DUF496 family)